MPKLLDAKNSLLLIIDIQEKLVQALDKQVVVSKAATLAKASKIMGIQTLLTEQYPQGLGCTAPAISQNLLPDTITIAKTSFSAYAHEDFRQAIEKTGKKQIIICGIETHICVHQTASDLLDAGYEVFVAKDACASRNKYEFKQGIDRMEANGAKISCVEIILFEWLKSAKNPYFKEVQSLIK